MAKSAIIIIMLKEDIFEKSIKSFEYYSGLSITVHDLSELIWPYLSALRSAHSSPVCRAVKMSEHNKRCIQLEVIRLRQNMDSIRNGKIHVCHAGLVEWIAPVRFQDRVIAILFAGQRRPGKGLQIEKDIPPTEALLQASVADIPPVVCAEEAGYILESLMQLAARMAEAFSVICNGRPAGAESIQDKRRRLIQNFVKNNYTCPANVEDLAVLLNVSPSRCAHIVRETHNSTLSQLLRKERMLMAANLLRTTELPIDEIALRCGVNDLSHFHRYFKSETGIPPGLFRLLRENR